MKILTDKEATEQGIITKRDLKKIIQVLRLEMLHTGQYVSYAEREKLAVKLEINLKKAFKR